MNEKKKKFALQYNCRANLILMFLEWRLMEHTLTTNVSPVAPGATHIDNKCFSSGAWCNTHWQQMFLEWHPVQHTLTTNISRVAPGATHIDNKCFSSGAWCNTHWQQVTCLMAEAKYSLIFFFWYSSRTRLSRELSDTWHNKKFKITHCNEKWSPIWR